MVRLRRENATAIAYAYPSFMVGNTSFRIMVWEIVNLPEGHSRKYTIALQRKGTWDSEWHDEESFDTSSWIEVEEIAIKQFNFKEKS